MTVRAKICGINSREALDAAIAGGADFVGFNFYPPSPRALTAAAAGELARTLPASTVSVGLFVDEPDERIAATLAEAPLAMLQLHGAESPARVAAVKARFGLPVMKAIKIADAADLDAVDPFIEVVDWLLFDAKAPPEMKGALPGGNALSFEWSILGGRRWARPWMLSGGLNTGNLADAVRISGAGVVDTSSGVEDRPGVKSPMKIKQFLELAHSL